MPHYSVVRYSTSILSGLLALGALSLTGCKSKNPMPTGDTTAANPPVVSPPMPQPRDNAGENPQPAANQHIAVSLTADKTTINRGQLVTFTITARNTTDTPQKLIFASGQRFDVVASGTNGKEAWRWSQGKAFTMMFGNVNWRPGETKTWTATWEQNDNNNNTLPRGQYQVRAELASTPRLTTESTTLTLTD